MEQQKVTPIHNGKQRKSLVGKRKLGEILIETGLLHDTRLHDALEKQRNTGKRLGQVLLEMKLLTEEEIAFALAMQLRIPFIDLSTQALKMMLWDIYLRRFVRNLYVSL